MGFDVCGGDSAAVERDNSLADGQSESGPAGLGVTRGIDAIKGLEQINKGCLGDAWAPIHDRDTHFAVTELF